MPGTPSTLHYEALHPLAGWTGLVMQVVRIGNRLFATGGLGSDGQVVVSDDDGRSWTPTTWRGTVGRGAWKGHMPSTKQHGLRQIWGWSARELIAVGEYGTIISSTNGGATWTQEKHAPAGCLFGVIGRGESLYIAGDDGIFKRKRAGKAWTRIDEHRNLCRIWPLPPAAGEDVGDLMVIGDGGVMLRVRSDDSVMSVRSGTRDDLYGFLAVDARHWIVCGKRGLVMVSDDAGASFERVPTPPAPDGAHDLFAVVKLHDELFAIVGHKGTVMLSPTGRRWQMQEAPDGGAGAVDLWGAWAARNGTLYIAGGGGHAWCVRDFASADVVDEARASAGAPSAAAPDVAPRERSRKRATAKPRKRTKARVRD